MRYRVNPDVVAMGSAVRSLYLVTQYIDLPKAGFWAIAHHNDLHIEDSKVNPKVFHINGPRSQLALEFFVLSFRGDHTAWTFSAFATV